MLAETATEQRVFLVCIIINVLARFRLVIPKDKITHEDVKKETAAADLNLLACLTRP